jgi:hypothetical protein
MGVHQMGGGVSSRRGRERKIRVARKDRSQGDAFRASERTEFERPDSRASSAAAGLRSWRHGNTVQPGVEPWASEAPASDELPGAPQSPASATLRTISRPLPFSATQYARSAVAAVTVMGPARSEARNRGAMFEPGMSKSPPT